MNQSLLPGSTARTPQWRRLLQAAAFGSMFAAFSSSAVACTACMGDPSSKVAGAINGAIFFMLGAIGLMLTCLSCFAISLIRRAGNPAPPHAELFTESTEPETYL